MTGAEDRAALAARLREMGEKDCEAYHVIELGRIQPNETYRKAMVHTGRDLIEARRLCRVAAAALLDPTPGDTP